jgi:hypothetical protein
VKGAFFIFGRTLQVIGMGTVLIAFLSFFKQQDMGVMMKTTIIGVVEFYVGFYIVGVTGEKTE